ncbi:hypothetical protein ABZW18_31585 [Streptomyces sp. NPDC004647]|uniref:hypothetical protein n=1 Tax=Streptomyces sp. NPDC004647 TaxID=3154671 RepID=UPI0033B0E267
MAGQLMVVFAEPRMLFAGAERVGDRLAVLLLLHLLWLRVLETDLASSSAAARSWRPAVSPSRQAGAAAAHPGRRGPTCSPDVEGVTLLLQRTSLQQRTLALSRRATPRRFSSPLPA